MTFHAHLQHTETGLAIVFAGPVSRLDMAPDVAAHLASLLAIEARHRMLGVVAVLNTERLENKQKGVGHYCGAAAENKQNRVTADDDDHPFFCDCMECL